MQANRAACQRVAFLLSATCGAGFAPCANAQAFPSKPITYLYNQAASGGPSELAQRAALEEMGKRLGQPIVWDFRPGAGGRLVVQAVQRAQPDGYVIASAHSASLTILPLGSDSYKPEPVKDYMPLTVYSRGFLVMTSHPSLPFRDIKGLIAYAKANPGKLSFGTAGVGSPSHIAWEQFMLTTGTEFLHVPYKGGDANADRLAGRLSVYLSSAQTKGMVDSGQLIGLAAASPRRLPTMSNVPTLQEQLGMPLVYSYWSAVIAPPATPRPILSRLHEVLVASFRGPHLGELPARAGWEDQPLGTPDESAAYIRAELEANGQIVRKLGLKFD